MSKFKLKHFYKLETLLLIALKPKELYGREIPDVIKKASGGRCEIRIGSLYPTLRKLERDGLIEAEARPSMNISGAADRRYYSLTAKGRALVSQCITFEHYLSQGVALSPADRDLSHENNS